MFIKKLQLLNFQVIEKFEAEFDGAIYFVTGDNELGKSTLLKAIGALLTGQRDEVLRNGASKGFAKMIVGDDGEEFDVQLSFTEANPRGTLTIKQASTGMQSNNVSMLQRIFGYQDFDAVEFSRWSETAEGRRKQVAVIKSLLPDKVRERIEVIDAEVSELKEERKGINRDVKTFANLRDAAAAMLEDGDKEKYAESMDVAELMERAKTEAQLAEKAKQARKAIEDRTAQLAGIPARKQAVEDAREAARKVLEKDKYDAELAYKAAIEKAQKDFDVVMGTLDKEMKDISIDEDTYKTRKDNAEKWLEKYEANREGRPDVAAMLEQAQEHNRKWKLVKDYEVSEHTYNEAKKKADAMDDHLLDLVDERQKLVEQSKLPIDGLTFTEDGLMLNGVPFVPGQVSDSQTMEVAAKLVIACNPKVKVFRIARGESLGAKRLQTIVDIAKRNGFQGFIEQVQRGQDEMRVEEYTEA